MVVHPVLPEPPSAAVAEVLEEAGVEHVAYPVEPALRSAEAAAADPRAVALVGPHRSADVAEAGGDRAAVLAALRRLGGFDEHGDPFDPPVWVCRSGADRSPASARQP